MAALDYIFFCRPLLLIPVWTFYLLFVERLYETSLLSFEHIFSITAMTAITAGAYVINQVYDIKTDRINKKLGFFDPPVSLSKRSARALYALLTGAPLFVSAITFRELLIPLIIAALVGWAYSAPPLRAKDRPLAGLLFNALPYSAMVWWGVSVASSGSVAPLFRVSAEEALAVAAAFCAVSATYILTTVSDREGDREVGKQTIGAMLTPKTSSLVSAGFAFLALTLAFIGEFWSVAIAAFFATALATVAAVRNSGKTVLLATKAPILILALAAVYRFPWYGVFLVALIALTRLYYRRRFNMVYPRLQ